MAFLDNSGDIILDAVLTDTGRMRLAKGDGSFRIDKFSLGDDEINYKRYDKTLSSAYRDLEILSTPILEAFTNNASSMKSRLITIPQDNVLYMPVLKLNEVFNTTSTARHPTLNCFLICVNTETETIFSNQVGALFGNDPISDGKYIRVDQGLDTTEISPDRALDSLLVETSYLIELDYRLGTIVSEAEALEAPLSFIDDDLMATYNVASGVDTSFVKDNPVSTVSANEVISGPRGTILEFGVRASNNLNLPSTSTSYYFNTLGTTESLQAPDGTTYSVQSIDTTVRVTGVSTGYQIDIPIKYIRKI